MRGFPPKVILLNLGNVSNTRILEVLLAQAEYIQGFLQSGAQGVLEID